MARIRITPFGALRTLLIATMDLQVEGFGAFRVLGVLGVWVESWRVWGRKEDLSFEGFGALGDLMAFGVSGV